MSNLEPTAPKRQRSVVDSTCIIGGIIVGPVIFETPTIVAWGMGGPIGIMAIRHQ